MAVTWIKPTYAHKRYNNATTIKYKIDYITDKNKTVLEYAMNPDKTGCIDDAENEIAYDAAQPIPVVNELITGYECFPEHAAEEFATSMELYEYNTGRKHTDNSRMLYHMTQSFAEGEVDPRIANRIGQELALEFTRGNHAFVFATHVNTKCVHNHIIFNAFNLESTGKFKDPYFSAKRDVARISDKLCREYGLSVIEVKQGWREAYNIWEEEQGITKADKPPTNRKRLEDIITLCLEKRPKDFEHLLKYMADYNCIAKRRGQNISVKVPFSKNSIRLSSLSDGFKEYKIRRQIENMNKIPTQSITPTIDENTENIWNIENISGNNFKPSLQPTKSEPPKSTPPKPSVITQTSKPKLQLIIDIQNSMKATENISYKNWAEKFNLEQMSQTLIFIEKHQLTFGELQNMATQKPKVLQNIKREIESVDENMQQISQLQRCIGIYSRTKSIYKQYRQFTNKEQRVQFRRENSKAVSDYEDAREYFSEHGYGFKDGENNLPTIEDLKKQYAVQNTAKCKLWDKYHEINRSDREIGNAWGNVKAILNVQDDIKIERRKLSYQNERH